MTGTNSLSTSPRSSTDFHFPDWLFWSKWIGASTAAVLLAFAIISFLMFLGAQMVAGFNEDRAFTFIFFPGLALALGIFQWLVLRKHIRRAGWWILATVTGMLLGVTLSAGILQFIDHFGVRTWDWNYQPGLLLLYITIGSCLAGVQFLFLKRFGSPASIWLLINMLGWLALGLVIGEVIDSSLEIIALGVVPALFSGFALSWCLKTQQ